MANRIAGNVIIIDSAMGNNTIFWTTTGNLADKNWSIASIAFWSSDTTGTFKLSLTNTADLVVNLANPLNAPNTVGIYLGGAHIGDTIKCPTLSTGTGYIYLK